MPILKKNENGKGFKLELQSLVCKQMKEGKRILKSCITYMIVKGQCLSLAVLFKLKICERIKTAKFIRIQENIPSLSFWSQEITIKVSTNNGRCKSSDSCHKFLYPCIWPYRHCQTNSNVWNFPGIEMTEKSKFELIIYSNRFWRENVFPDHPIENAFFN